jgi:hypothetical protein
MDCVRYGEMGFGFAHFEAGFVGIGWKIGGCREGGPSGGDNGERVVFFEEQGEDFLVESNDIDGSFVASGDTE